MSAKNSKQDGSDLTIKAIENGTVIDHITPGRAFNVLKILGIDESFKKTVSVVINAQGSDGEKDVVKIHNMELTKKQVAAISLIAPKATVNIIRDYKVVRKSRVEVPKTVTGIVKCINPNCITNSREPVESSFIVVKMEDGSTKMRCRYCESVISDDAIAHII